MAGQCFYLLRNLCRLKNACITTVGLLEDEVRDAGFEIPIYEGDRREIESEWVTIGITRLRVITNIVPKASPVITACLTPSTP